MGDTLTTGLAVAEAAGVTGSWTVLMGWEVVEVVVVVTVLAGEHTTGPLTTETAQNVTTLYKHIDTIFFPKNTFTSNQ